MTKQKKCNSVIKMETKQIKWKTAFVTISFIMTWDSWAACERLGMCCVEEGPFPLNHMPLKIHYPPSNSPKRTLEHTRPFCQRSRRSLHPTLPSPAQHRASPHKHPQITDTSCAGEYNARAGAAQLASLPTWHWLDLWHVTHPPRKPFSSPDWFSLLLYLLSAHAWLRGRAHAQRWGHPQVT